MAARMTLQSSLVLVLSTNVLPSHVSGTEWYFRPSSAADAVADARSKAVAAAPGSSYDTAWTSTGE